MAPVEAIGPVRQAELQLDEELMDIIEQLGAFEADLKQRFGIFTEAYAQADDSRFKVRKLKALRR